MQLTEEQFAQLMSATPNKAPSTQVNVESMQGFVDNAVKFLVAMSTAGVLWLVNTTNQLQNDMVELKTRGAGYESTLLELKEFTKMPRFTQESFVQAVAPMQQMLLQHDDEIRRRNVWVTTTEAQVNRLEQSLEFLEGYAKKNP